MISLEINSRIKIPTVMTIGPCNASRSNAVVMAKLINQDFLYVTNIRLDDKRGIIISASAERGNNRYASDYMLEDIEKY